MPADMPSSLWKKLYWVGWVISVLPAGMLLMSAGAKLMGAEQVMEGMPKLGWEASMAFGLGVVELACVVFYLIPQTAVLGAILLTGYMGGAIATHVRLHQDIAWPTIFGVVLWLGLYLRDGRVRELLPLRR